MYTPKWFDYSSKSFDELKYINTNARIGFTTFSTCTDPNRPHCAALCVQINNGTKVQLTPFMSWKRLYLTIIHPLYLCAETGF